MACLANVVVVFTQRCAHALPTGKVRLARRGGVHKVLRGRVVGVARHVCSASTDRTRLRVRKHAAAAKADALRACALQKIVACRGVGPQQAEERSAGAVVVARACAVQQGPVVCLIGGERGLRVVLSYAGEGRHGGRR